MSTAIACARQRTFKIIQLPAVSSKGLVRVTVNDISTDYEYDVLRIDREIGQCALELKKLEPESIAYHVLVAHDRSCLCDCMGYLRWGNTTGRCKHCDLAWPLIEETHRRQAEQDHAEARAAVEQGQLQVRQQSEQTLVIETPTGQPVASIECNSGLTGEHVRNANYIAANPAELIEPERIEANVEQLPDTAFKLLVADDAGNRIAEIISPSGLCRSHHKLAALIRCKPFLLTNAEQLEALEQSIAGTSITVA